MKKLYIADIRGSVIDGKVYGHIVPVAKNYKTVLETDYDVRIAAGRAILNSFDKTECIILPYNVGPATLINKLKTFTNFIVLLWKAKGCPVILQQSTTVTAFIAIILFYWWTSPLYMIQYNTDALNSGIKRVINKLAQMKLTGNLCPTERIGKAYGGRYCVVPDYFFIEKQYTILPIEQKKWDIGIIGGITANKGTVEAARYLANKNIKVIIAGRICENGLEQALRDIASSSSNIDLRIGYLTDEDYQRYIKESKFCMLNYHGTYFDRSSGAVLDALYNGTPVIGTKCEALKMVCEKKLGIVYNDIRDINYEKVIISKEYDVFVKNIENFLEEQSQYKENLLSFLK